VHYVRRIVLVPPSVWDPRLVLGLARSLPSSAGGILLLKRFFGEEERGLRMRMRKKRYFAEKVEREKSFRRKGKLFLGEEEIPLFLTLLRSFTST